MITMGNVLKRGRTVWDRALLPDDEYVERIRAVRAEMEAAGLDALVAFGHATHHGNLTYLSGNVPPLGWMATVLGREGEPILVTGGGSRDLPFLRTQTWIADVRASASLFSGPAATVAAAVADVAEGGRVGLVGARVELAMSAHAELLEALAAHDVVEADGLLAGRRALKRPREQDAMRRSLEVARGAIAGAAGAWAEGASGAEALLAAERLARLGGARDVRVLGTLDGEELSPVEAASDERREALVAYCAVERLGYWAQAVLDTRGADAGAAPPSAAVRALEAMLTVAGPDVPAGELAAAAVRELPEGARDVALSYGLGGGVGLDLGERPTVVPGGEHRLAPGSVLALQVFTREAGVLRGASATVRIDASGVVPW
jgi:Xaa-Pro aminopeptidase